MWPDLLLRLQVHRRDNLGERGARLRRHQPAEHIPVFTGRVEGGATCGTIVHS